MGEQKKSSKAGTNKKGCEAYKASMRHEKNKASRLFKHLVKCSHKEIIVKDALCLSRMDESAQTALKPLIGYLTPARRAKLNNIIAV